MIPNIGYGNKKKIHSDEKFSNLMSSKCRADITSRVSVNGGMLTFSFCVEAADEIKCYFWWLGQCIRFLPQDLVDILPRLFDNKYGNNDKFDISNSSVKDIVNKVTFKDNYFYNWYTKTTSKHNQQDLDKYALLQQQHDKKKHEL